MLPDEITITWSIHDVHEAVEGLTDDQARAVLQLVKRSHDANQGISWETLQIAAETLFGVTNAPSE
jgi:hypothetical protein